ncbi:MAG TPA: hypothetical protein VI977_05305 [archaeon]|nr:hypothetical protein [archaeon]
MGGKINLKFELKSRRTCMHCGKEAIDNGTVAFLRGFCSDECYATYLQKARQKK